MKRVKQNWKQRVAAAPHDRQGSVIVVVIALLSSLMILGFFLFSLADQENENAEYFLQGSKNISVDEINPNYYFDTFLRQFIIGPNKNEFNSALYGGHMSLMTTMNGTDMNPYDGEGVNAVWATGPTGPLPRSDRNHDGTPDIANPANDYLMHLNWSPAAVENNPLDGTRAYSLGNNTDGTQLPQKDVNYSYADHNSPFLTYYGYAPQIQRSDGSLVGYQRVILPAFHRPPLLRRVESESTPGSAVVPSEWYEDPATKERVLRPHKEHNAIVDNGSGLPVSSGVRRFVSDVYPETGITPYPHDALQEGIWAGPLGTPISYEADPTGRGWNDAVYLDLGLPLQVNPETGEEFVALVAPTVLSAEAYANLNVAGNDPYLLANTDITSAPLGGGSFLTQSNTGYSRSEINPAWILNALPAVAAGEFTGTAAELNNALEAYRLMFGHNPADRAEMSNMELFRLLHGAPLFSSGATVPTTSADIVDYYRGRWTGEAEEGRIANGINSNSSLAWPWPGFSAGPGIDDNSNNDFGNGFGYPFDNFGTGVNYQGTNYGKNRNLLNLNRFRYPAFANLIVHPNSQYNNLDNNPPFSNQLLPGKFPRSPYLQNEPEETIVDPRFEVSQSTDPTFRVDSIFGPGENAGLQLTSTDLTVWGISTRLQELASFNFRSSEREEEIRRKLTTLSSELNSHGKTAYSDPSIPAFRRYDYNADRDSDGIFEFPPIVSTVGAWNKTALPAQPIRPEVQELLHSELNDQEYRKLRRRLSLNHIVDRDGSNRLRYRPLTAHPTGLGKEPLRDQLLTEGNPPSTLSNPDNDISTIATQEYFARWDRQRLARDIYTLLYALGGANNAVYSTTNYLSQDNSGFGLYSAAELRRMAQVAVNLVDQMDSDNIITVFEYDTNLSDGWGLNDNPYFDDATEQAAQRKYVYGVEKMQLNFSEGLAIFAPATEDRDDPGMPKAKADHEGTEWNDTTDHQFLFVELQNSSNQTITFNNEEWQLVVRPYSWTIGDPTTTTAGTAAGPERRLTFRSAAPDVGVGGASSFLTIGTVGNANNSNEVLPPTGSSSPWVPGTGDSGPASFTVRPNYQQASDSVEKIAPEIALNNSQYFDLLTDTTGYRLNEAAGNPDDYEDGARITPNDSDDPSGKRLLEFTAAPDFSANNYEVEVVLRRRLNPGRTSPNDGDTDFDEQSRDNPWVVADRYRIPLREFDLVDDEADSSAIQGELAALRSRGRWQPLYGNPADDSFAEYYDSNSFIGNSLGNYNRGPNAAPQVPNPYTLWQPHQDRFFTSLAEVFNVPLYGPDRLNEVDVVEDDGTDNLWSTNPYWRGPNTRIGRAVTDGRDAKLADEQTFGHVVLNPDEDQPDDGTADNLWYRVLEFMTVPTQQHVDGYTEVLGRSLAGSTNVDTVYREFGSINVNEVKDPEVLAAMIDEPDVIRLDNITSTTAAALTDLGHVNGTADPLRRDWWTSYLLNRDGADPLNPSGAAEALVLPGIPGISRPYRPLSYIGSRAANGSFVADALNDTVLRKLRVVQGGGAGSPSTTLQDRGQFELGTEANHTSDDVDYAMRNRVLGKVMNHHTTTSNTFFVFLQVDFFEAKEVAPDVVRVGDKLTDSPAFRGFFVIDRAKALEILENTDLPRLDMSTNKFLLHYNQNFNWRALVLHRQRLN